LLAARCRAESPFAFAASSGDSIAGPAVSAGKGAAIGAFVSYRRRIKEGNSPCGAAHADTIAVSEINVVIRKIIAYCLRCWLGTGKRIRI
jgi:hypothetical protein